MAGFIGRRYDSRATAALADEIVDVIQVEVAEYSNPLRGDFGEAIRLGTEQALRRFIGDDSDDESPSVYRAARIRRAQGRSQP